MRDRRAVHVLAGPLLGLTLVGGGLVLGGCADRAGTVAGTPAAPSSSTSTTHATTAFRPHVPPRAATATQRPHAARVRPTTTTAEVTPVTVVPAYIPFSDQRKAETAAYARRHYGVASWHLRPSMVVLHFTETTTMSSARNTFAQDVPNTGELPGTCAHFIVDQDGRVYGIVPVTTLCRHTIGLNDKAIGIEMVQSTAGHSAQWADQQILERPAQITSVLRLVHQLQAQWGIPASRVIGHAMANDDPAFRDLRGWRNDHSDWQAVDVQEVRRRLAGL